MRGPTPKHPERDAGIVNDRADGMTYRALGLKYGLGKDRCRDIVCKAKRMAALVAKFPTRFPEAAEWLEYQQSLAKHSVCRTETHHD